MGGFPGRKPAFWAFGEAVVATTALCGTHVGPAAVGKPTLSSVPIKAGLTTRWAKVGAVWLAGTSRHCGAACRWSL